MRDLSGERALVQALDIALRQNINGALHEDLDEVRNPRAHFIAHRAIRRDGGRNRDHAVAREQLTDKADAPDVFVAVLLAEAQSFGEMRANYVAIQHLYPGPLLAQPQFQRARNRALARAAHAREP